MKEEGPIQGHITFHSIDHQTKQAKVTYYNEEGPYPVRFHEWPAAMNFFELLENGELYPIITTVLDEYTQTLKRSLLSDRTMEAQRLIGFWYASNMGLVFRENDG